MGSKKKMNAFLRKSAAVLTVSAMIAASPSMVLADGNYRDTEKKVLSTLIQGITETWDASMAEINTSENTGKAKMTLQLEDAGRSLLGFVVPADISWLDRITMDMDVSVIDGVESIAADILLNDTSVATLNMLMDLAEGMEYVQIPELSESWLKAALTVTDEDGTELTEEAMKDFYSAFSDLPSVLPDAATVETLLDRYGNLVIDHMEEGPSIEENVSVEGIGEDCTVYEGQIYEKNAYELAEEVLTTAMDDAELKSLIESIGAVDPDTEDLYGQFQEAVEEALTEIKAQEGSEDTGYVSSKIWVNGEGKIIGRELGFCEGVDTQPLFTWKNPSNGDASALLLELAADTNTFTFTGSGETKDGMLNGTYNLAIDHVSAVNVEVKDYDVEAAKTGYPNGSVALSFVPGPEGDEESYNTLSNFGLVINLISDAAAETCDIELAVTSAGSTLGSLIISGSNEEAGETPKLDDVGTTYDVSNEEDMNAYFGEMNWDTILDNAAKAGVPEELVAQLDSMLQNALSGEGTAEENAPEEIVPEENEGEVLEPAA